MAERLPHLHAGVYRHYKGPLYQVLGYAHDANHEGRAVVLYLPLQLDGAKTGPRLAVRTAEDFLALVHEDGEACLGPATCPLAVSTPAGLLALSPWDRDHQPRFRYLGPSWDGQP